MRRTPLRRRNKYKAIKTFKDGIKFDSKLEASWYEYLKILGAAGQVKNLELQKEFTIYVQEKQICTYIADYFYFDPSKGKYVVGDAKGVLTDVFRLKWKLMQAVYPDYHYQIFKGKPFR